MGLKVPFRRHIFVNARVFGVVAVIAFMLWALAEDIDIGSRLPVSTLCLRERIVTPAGRNEEAYDLDETFLNSAYKKHLECKDGQAGFATGSANGTKFIAPLN
jgi:hypothetical protein